MTRLLPGVRPCPECARRGLGCATWSPCACVCRVSQTRERYESQRARRTRRRIKARLRALGLEDMR